MAGEIDPSTYTDYIDNYVPDEPNPYVPDADYSNEGRNYPTTESTQGPGGSPVNASTNWLNNIPSWAKSLFQTATSGPGIAGLGGAALGFLDRAKPSGGGTAQAYQGPMDLTRTMVQGPYGPLAEYKSSFYTGAPDYRDFTGPAPAPGAAPTPAQPPAAPSRSIDSKIAEYRQLASYGLSNDRIRRIAETFYGPQTDADWAELTRLAGGTTGGIRPPAPPPAAPAPVGAPAPAGGISTLKPPTALTPAPAPSGIENYNTNAAMEYINMRKLPGSSGGSISAIKDVLEKKYGPQSQSLLDRYEAAYKEHLDYMEEQKNASAPPPALLTPAPPPPAAAPAAPEGSEGYRFAMQPGGIGEEKFYENIANFIRTNPTEEAARAAMQQYGISDADVYRAKLKYNLLEGGGFYDQSQPGGFAHGGAVQMEDGGFVMTEKAVKGAKKLVDGGITQLLPDARMIRGPGTGTSDEIPAVINGPNGQTPARLSNGEAYVPPGRNTKGLYALMHQLERKA